MKTKAQTVSNCEEDWNLFGMHQVMTAYLQMDSDEIKASLIDIEIEGIIWDSVMIYETLLKLWFE
jgi:hypothetical protein